MEWEGSLQSLDCGPAFTLRPAPVAAGRGPAPFGEQLAPLRRVAWLAPLRGQARSQRVERLAELVDGAEELSLQRSDDQTAASRVTHEPLCLEDGERLSDGLTGDAQAGGEGVLVQPLASRQPPGADRFEDGFVGLLDERRAGPQRLDRRRSEERRVG